MSEHPTYEELKISVQELERIKLEHKLIQQEHQAVLEVLKLINETESLKDLIGRILLSIKNLSGCEAVAIRLKEGPDFPYYVTSGFSDEFVQLEKHLCSYREDGEARRDINGDPILECMCGNILLGRVDPTKDFFTPDGSFWSNCTTQLLSTTTDADRQTRTRNRCNSVGYESVALIPLRSAKETFGLIQLNDHREGMFTPELIAMYRRIADYIAGFLAKRQAREALWKSEAMLRTLINTLPDLVWLKDPDGVYLACNSRFERFFGAKEDAIIGRTDYDFLSIDEANFFRGKDQDAMIAGKPCVNEEEIFFSDDGHRELLETIKTPFYGPNGEIIGVLGIARDITQRKEAQEALQESEERLLLVMEGSQLGYWDWNIETGEVKRNKRWAEMLGYTLQEIEFTVNQWTNLHHPDDSPIALKSLQDHLDGKTPAHRAEYRMRTKEGSYKWILDQSRVVKRDAQGKPLRMSGTHTDITEQKQKEGEREKLQAQLAQAQKMESVGRLAGGVAHDFNNMLSVILGHSEMALEQAGPDQVITADLQEIQTAARRSADITRQLLAFARKQTIAPKVVDLNETVEGMLRMLRRLIGEDIDLHWLPGRNTPLINIDPSQIDQILVNLCINARDAITDTGTLTIETGNAFLDKEYCDHHTGAIPGDYILLAISDNGCGMDQMTLEHLFEPFFTTKGVDKGTGLGLATVYGIVKQNNGFINVYSEPGHGTTFKIYLPRHQSKTETLPEKPKDDSAGYGHETILLVEDEPAILNMTKMMLEKLGYQVIPAKTPDEAIHFARECAGEIHLLITDVIMPEMNGRDLAKKIHALYPGLKRLFMSGYTADIIAHHGVLDEGVYFIQKPFSREILGIKVRESLDATKDRIQY